MTVKVRFILQSFKHNIYITEEKEIMTRPERVQQFIQHDKLHMFLVGNGGANFRKLCPRRDQDGDVYYRAVQGYGAMKVEVNSTMFSAQYLLNDIGEVYRVNVYR